MLITLSIQVKPCPCHHYHTLYHNLQPRSLEPRNLGVHSFLLESLHFLKSFSVNAAIYFNQNLLPLDFSNWGLHGPIDMEATGFKGAFPKAWISLAGSFNTFYTKNKDRFVVEETYRGGVGMLMWKKSGTRPPNVREADGTDGPLIVMLLPKCCSWSFQVPLQPPLESKYWPVIQSWPKSPEEKSPRGNKGWGVFWEGISSKIKRDPWEAKPSFSAMWHLMPRQQQPFSEPKEMGSPMSQSPKIPENIDGGDQVMFNPIQLQINQP